MPFRLPLHYLAEGVRPTRLRVVFQVAVTLGPSLIEAESVLGSFHLVGSFCAFGPSWSCACDAAFGALLLAACPLPWLAYLAYLIPRSLSST